MTGRWPRPAAHPAADPTTPTIGHFPDLGQMLTWGLGWQHTALLVDDQRGNCIESTSPRSPGGARPIAAELAARYWPPDASRLPWVVSAYPEACRWTCGIRRRPGGTAVRAADPVEDRMGPRAGDRAHHFIEVDEYGLALEEIAGMLGQDASGHHGPGTRRHAGPGPPDEGG